ncbi:MFS transporter [Nocardia cerradoensis]|uniref:MFS transporter n=1 Tax=Nocardia cerradoensis TaxID=85688 RepID=UPI0016762FB8|nr:MFS transporter [Nocardia cerradoensis]
MAVSSDHLKVLLWICQGRTDPEITEALPHKGNASTYIRELASAFGIPTKRYLIAAEGARRGLVSVRAPLTDLRGVLTPRQIVVLAHLSRGLSRREIADKLSISIRTVDEHVERSLPRVESPSLVTAMPRIVGALDAFDEDELTRLAESASGPAAPPGGGQAAGTRLSAEEATVLRLVGRGLTYSDIATETGMVAREVRRALARARKKVGDSSKRRAAALLEEQRARRAAGGELRAARDRVGSPVPATDPGTTPTAAEAQILRRSAAGAPKAAGQIPEIGDALDLPRGTTDRTGLVAHLSKDPTIVFAADPRVGDEGHANPARRKGEQSNPDTGAAERATAAAEANGSLLRLVRNSAEARTLFSGQLVAGIGTSASQNALTLLMMGIDPQTAAIVAGLSDVPRLVLAPYMGYLADTIEPTRMMKRAKWVMFGASAVAAATSGFQTPYLVPTLIGANLVNTAADTLYGPAASRVNRAIIGSDKRLQQGLSQYNAFVTNLSRTIGNSLAGALEPWVLFGLDSAASGVNVAGLRRVRELRPAPKQTEPQSFRDRMRTVFVPGFEALHQDTILRNYTWNLVVTNGYLGAQHFFFIHSLTAAGLSGAQTSAAFILPSIGGIIGNSLPKRWLSKVDIHKLLAARYVGLTGMAASALITAFTNDPYIGGAGYAAGWVALGATNVHTGAYFNQNVPEDRLGRASSFLNVSRIAAYSLAGLAGGTLIANQGATPTAIGMTAAMGTITAGSVIRRFDVLGRARYLAASLEGTYETPAPPIHHQVPTRLAADHGTRELLGRAHVRAADGTFVVNPAGRPAVPDGTYTVSFPTGEMPVRRPLEPAPGPSTPGSSRSAPTRPTVPVTSPRGRTPGIWVDENLADAPGRKNDPGMVFAADPNLGDEARAFGGRNTENAPIGHKPGHGPPAARIGELGQLHQTVTDLRIQLIEVTRQLDHERAQAEDALLRELDLPVPTRSAPQSWSPERCDRELAAMRVRAQAEREAVADQLGIAPDRVDDVTMPPAHLRILGALARQWALVERLDDEIRRVVEPLDRYRQAVRDRQALSDELHTPTARAYLERMLEKRRRLDHVTGYVSGHVAVLNRAGARPSLQVAAFRHRHAEALREFVQENPQFREVYLPNRPFKVDFVELVPKPDGTMHDIWLGANPGDSHDRHLQFGWLTEDAATAAFLEAYLRYSDLDVVAGAGFSDWLAGLGTEAFRQAGDYHHPQAGELLPDMVEEIGRRLAEHEQNWFDQPAETMIESLLAEPDPFSALEVARTLATRERTEADTRYPPVPGRIIADRVGNIRIGGMHVPVPMARAATGRYVIAEPRGMDATESAQVIAHWFAKASARTPKGLCAKVAEALEAGSTAFAYRTTGSPESASESLAARDENVDRDIAASESVHPAGRHGGDAQNRTATLTLAPGVTLMFDAHGRAATIAVAAPHEQHHLDDALPGLRAEAAAADIELRFVSDVDRTILDEPAADDPTPQAPVSRQTGSRRRPARGAMPPTRNQIADALDIAPRRVAADPAIGEVPGGVTPWTVTRFDPGRPDDPRRPDTEEAAGRTVVPEIGRLAAELRSIGPSFAYVDDLLRIAAGVPHGPAWIDSPDYWEWQLDWLAERGPRLSTLAAFSAAALEAEAALGLPNTSGRALLLAQLRPRTPGEMMAIYKLETMRADEPDRPSGPDTAAHASAIGRVERELSLDELPQYAYLPTVAARPILQADRDLTRKYQTPAEFGYFDPIPRDGVFGANYPGCRALDRQSPEYHRARYAGDSLLPMIACRPVYDRFLNHWIEPYQLRHAMRLRDGFQGTTSVEGRIAQWFTSAVADVLAAPPDAAPEILDDALRTQLRRTRPSTPANERLRLFTGTVHELLGEDYDFGHYLRSRDHPETEGYIRTVRETVLRRHPAAAVARVPFLANIIDASGTGAALGTPEGGPAPATLIGARPGPARHVAPEFDPAILDRPDRGADRRPVDHVPAEPMWAMGFHHGPDGRGWDAPISAAVPAFPSRPSDEAIELFERILDAEKAVNRPATVLRAEAQRLIPDEIDRAYAERYTGNARRSAALAAQLGITPEQLDALTAEELKQAFEGEIVHRTTSAALLKILRDGRFKTLFEIAGRGVLARVPLVARQKLEQVLFGYGQDLPLELRPVHSRIRKSWRAWIHEADFAPVQDYGDVDIVLKSTVRERTTGCLGSPTQSDVIPSALAEPRPESFNAVTSGHGEYGYFGLEGVDRDYDGDRFHRNVLIQAQTHGGVQASDIAYVVFHGERPGQELRDALEAAGIPWISSIDNPGPTPASLAAAVRPADHTSDDIRSAGPQG